MNGQPDTVGLEIMPDAVVVVGADRRVRAANTLASRMAQVPVAQMIGQDADRVLRLEEAGGNHWWTCGAQLQANPTLLPRIAEQRLVLHRATAPPMQVTVTGRRIAGPDGEPDAVAISLRRADRRAAEERRRSDLISTASHELRSPLTSVSGFTKTLLARWDKFDDATRRQMVATIDEDADRVTRLLTSLLDVSRIDTGRLPLRRQIADIADVIAPLVRGFGVEHPSRTLIVDVPDDLPDLLLDRDRIGQVLTNLLDNAAKHGAGTVSVRAQVVDGQVRVTVADQGGEVPAAEVDKLFVKHYRRQGRRTAGLGLGLYISRGIVVAHGGRMWAVSTAEEGTSFYFALPVAATALAG